MFFFGNHDEYNGKVRVHIVNHKDRIQWALQICSLVISIVTIACIFCYHGLYITTFAKNAIRLVIHGSLFFYVIKYFVQLFYSLHRSEYLKQSWFEFLIILLLILQFISINIFHIDFFDSQNFENIYLIFIQFYFLIMVLVELAKASSSLPYVAQVTMVDGVPMLDGGIVDSIPVLRAASQGHPFNVVVMTRNKGFRSTERDMKIPPIIYKEYPRLRVALSHRVEVYNEQLEMVERMERWGEILVIRPQRKMEVGRTCSDIAKLERLYEEGYEEGDKFCKNYLL